MPDGGPPALVAAVDAILARHDLPRQARLDQVTRAICDALEVERCWICRLDGNVLYTEAGVAMALADPRHDPLPLEKGIVGRTAREGRSRRIDDVLAVPEYFAAVALTRSELAVPILDPSPPERVIGVINIEANRVAAFASEHQEAVEEVAARLARSRDFYV
jgi:putative methionine-R-sulfoxide reductase with GAF domain